MRHQKSVKRRHESRKNDLSTIDLNEEKRAHANHKKEQDSRTNLNIRDITDQILVEDQRIDINSILSKQR